MLLLSSEFTIFLKSSLVNRSSSSFFLIAVFGMWSAGARVFSQPSGTMLQDLILSRSWLMTSVPFRFSVGTLLAQTGRKDATPLCMPSLWLLCVVFPKGYCFQKTCFLSCLLRHRPKEVEHQ